MTVVIFFFALLRTARPGNPAVPPPLRKKPVRKSCFPVTKKFFPASNDRMRPGKTESGVLPIVWYVPKSEMI